MGRKSEGNNESAINNNQELEVYRTRVYPAFAFGFATIAIILIEILVLISGFLSTSLIFRPPVLAAAKIWDGGGGVVTNWSTCTNWDLNVCPAAGDTVTFNATSSNNVTVDAGFAGTISSITIAAGYNGTITLARSLTVTNSYSQAAGSFSGAAQTMSVGTTFSLTAGTFTSTSGTMSVASTFTISGAPTFNNNGGIIDFNGSTATLTCNSVTFNTISFAGQTGVKTVSAGCTLPVGAAPTIPNGVSLSGTLSGTGTITNTTGTLTVNSGGVLSGFSGLTGTTNDLIVSGATLSLSTYNPVVIGGIFTVTLSGAFTAPSGTMSVGGNFTISSGTFTHNSGTVNFTGGAAVLACLSTTFNSVNFSGQTAVKTVNSDCSLPLGASPTIPNGITLSGTLSGSGTITNPTGSLTINSTGVLSGFSGLTGTSNNLIIIGANVNFGSYNPVVIGFQFDLQSGTFTAPSGTMTVGFSFNITAGSTFNVNAGTINFDGATSGGTISCNNVTFNIVTFTGSSTNSKTIASNCNINIGANPTIPYGIFLSGTLTGTGTFTTTHSLFISSGTLSGFTGLSANVYGTQAGTINFTGYSPFSIGSLGVNSSGGTTTFPSGATVAGPFVQSGGTAIAPSGSLNIAGNLQLSTGGVFNGGSGTTTIQGSVTHSVGTTINGGTGTISIGGAVSFLGTFTASSGTINFFGGIANINCNSTVFNLVTFTGQTGVKTIGNASSCTIPLGANPVIPNGVTLGSATLSGTGTFTQTTGTLTLVSGSALSGFSGLSGTTNSLTILSGSFNFGSYNPFFIGNAFSFTGSVFTAPTGTMSVVGDFSLSGSFTGNGGTVNFTGGVANINTGGNNFSNVNFNSQTGVKTLNGSSPIPLGNNPTIPNGLILSQMSLNGTGTLTMTTGTLTMNSSSSLSGFSGFTGTSNSLTLSSSSVNLSGYSPAFIPGDLTIQNSGGFIAPSGTLTVNGNLFVDPVGTYTHSSGTLALGGGSSVITCGPATLNNVTINTSGTKTFSGDCSTAGSFSLATGAVIAPSTTLTVSGSFTLSGSTTFTHNSGTVSFNGGIANIACNNQTFNSVNFTGQSGVKTVSSNCSLPLGSGPTIPNGITLNGTLSGSGTITNTTGTLTLNSGASLSGFSGLTGTTNGLTISGATVNFGSYSPAVVIGAFSLSSGSFTAPTGTLIIGGDLAISGGSFAHNSGTVNFLGGAANFSCASATFNLVSFSGQTGSKLLNSNCNFPLGNNPTIPNTVQLSSGSNSHLTGTGTLTQTAGTLILNSTTGISGFTGYTGTTNALTVTNVTANFSGYSPFVTNGLLTLNSGTLILPTNADINAGLTIAGGTLNGPSGAITIAGPLSISGAPTVNFSATTLTFDTTTASTAFDCGIATLNDVVIAATGAGSYIMTGDCTVNNFTMTSGTWLNPGSAFSLSVNADFAQNAATTFGGANLTVQFTGSSLQSISKTAGTFSSKFFVVNSGIAQLTTAFVVTTQICQVQGGGSIFFSNGFAFTCAGGFSVLSGGTLQRQGAEATTTPTLNSGSTVIYKGNGDSSATPYTINVWVYSNLVVNSTDGTSDTFTFNSNFTMASLTLTAGTLVKGASQTTLNAADITINGATWTTGAITLTNASSLTCTSGTLVATGATITTGNLLINGCTFTAPSGTYSITGDFTFTSGTFNAGGTVRFNGSTQNITCGSAVLNIMTFTVAGNKNIIGDCTTTGAVTATLGTINGDGTSNIIAGGLLTIGGATWGNAFTSITANAGLTCTTGSMSNGSATVDINGTLTINGCTFNADNSTMTISTNFTKTTGTFNGGTGTVTFDGGTQAVTCGSAVFNTVNFTTSGAKTLSGTCTTGIINMNAGTIGMAITSPWTMNGLLTINGATFTPGANTINANLGLVCSSGSFVGGTAVVSVNSALTVSGCTFTAPSVNMSVTGNFTYSSGTFTHNSGTITFEGESQSITCGTATLNTATFNSTGASGGTGRFWDVQDVYNGNLYVWGGNINGGVGTLSQTLDIYNIATNTWTTGAAGGTARQGASGGISNGKMYIWAGFTTTFINTIGIYDIAANTWSFGLAGGTARGGQTSNIYNGKMYSWGGDNNASVHLNTMDIYDISSNTWSTGTAGGTARTGHSSALYNGKIYYWGGYVVNSINTMDIYDIASNTWSTGTAGGTPRYYHTSVAFNGKVYAWAGTNQAGTDVNTMDIYDITSDTWSTGSPGGTARDSHSSTLYNGKIYSYGGFVPAISVTIPSKTIDVYDIASDSTNLKTINGNCTTGIINMTAGDIKTTASPLITAGGLFTVNGAQFTSGSSSIIANAGITCSSGFMDSTSATSVDVNGTLTISGCTFTSTAATMTISTNFTKTTGTFNHGSGTVTFDGGTQAVACGSSVFNTVNFTTAGAKTLSNTCTTGIVNMTAGTIGMAVTSPWTYNGLLTINGATFSPVANTVTANAAVICSSGAITGGTATFNVTGNFLISGCAFTNGGNTITASTGVTCSSGSLAGGAAALNINGDLLINGCTFTAPSVSLLLSGSFTYSSGTFTHNSGILNLDGDTQTLTCGSTTLNTLTFSTSGNKTIAGNCTAAAVNMNSGTIGTSGSPTITSTGLFTVAGGAWSTGTAGGAVRAFVQGVQSGGKIYVWGGTVGGVVVNTMDIFDIGTSTWSTGTAGGTARRGYSAVLYNNKIYMWGGCNAACNASFNTLDIYDIAGNSWSTGATGGTAKNSHMAFAYNDKMYIVTGFVTGPGFTNGVDIYDFIGNSWSTGTSGGVAKSNAAGVLFNGKIYSWSGSTAGAGLNTMDIYDIAGNSWSAGLAGGTGRLTASAVVFNGKMYGWGGCTDASCTVFTTITDIYDFTTNTWSTGISGGSSRRNFADVVYNNKRYATGNATMNVFDWGANFTTGTATMAMSGGLTCSSGSMDASSASSLVVTAYTISGCSFDAPSSGTFQVTGNYAFTGGQVHHNNGTVEFNGGVTTVNSGCATVTTCAPAFYNLTINKTLVTDTLSLLTNSIKAANTITITQGKLVQAALLNVEADGSTAVNVLSNGTWSNVLTGDVVLGGDVVNNGNITLEGTTAACVAEADAISITSTSAGVQRAWSGAGTFVFNDLTVQDQGGTAAIAARSSTNVSGNGSNWFFVGCTTTAPNVPTSLDQKKTDNTTVISIGAWTNETIVKFSATLTDTDNPDGLGVCVEAKPIGVSFTNVEDGCSSFVSYTGTGIVATYTPSSLADNTYHWQARTKDAGGLTSAWVSFGGNAESATDFGLDSTAPTGGTVFDGTGTGVDVTFNGGSGTSLSANWSGFNATISGLASYDYSIGTTIGGTDIVNWTTNSTTTFVTVSGLTLQTLAPYYFNVRANDNAGNSSIVSSNGQYVTPSLSFSVSTNTVTFDNLNNTNGYSSTKTTTITTSTNAFQGYVVKVFKSDLLRSIIQPAITINDFSVGSYAAPSQWNVGTYGFGYTSNDTTIQGVNKFGNSPCPGTGNAPCFAPFSSTAPGDIVADHTANVTGTPITNEAFIITYKVQVPNTQAAGKYTTNLIYSIIPKY